MLISNITYSQIHYVKVEPVEHYHYEHQEGYFDNMALFTFYIKDYNNYEQFSIEGYFPEYFTNTNDWKVSVKTGWEYQYTEKEWTPYSNGLSARITTYNLPRVAVVVYYDGDQQPIWIQDVTIEMMYKKYK